MDAATRDVLRHIRSKHRTTTAEGADPPAAQSRDRRLPEQEQHLMTTEQIDRLQNVVAWLISLSVVAVIGYKLAEVATR